MSNKQLTANENTCVLCGSIDRDLQTDHLRECYKASQDKLDNSMFHPRLTYDEMSSLHKGFNQICSNRRACAHRQLQSALNKAKIQ